MKAVLSKKRRGAPESLGSIFARMFGGRIPSFEESVRIYWHLLATLHPDCPRRRDPRGHFILAELAQASREYFESGAMTCPCDCSACQGGGHG